MDSNFQENFPERIRNLMQSEGLNAKQFADKVGMNQTAVSHLLSGRNKPSYDSVIGIKIAFPNLNIEWLMFGQLPMYKDNTSVNPAVPAADGPMAAPEEPNLFSEFDKPVSAPTPVSAFAPVSEAVRDENLAPENRVESVSSADDKNEATLEVQNPTAGPQVIREVIKETVARKISRIIVFYDDHSYEDFQH